MTPDPARQLLRHAVDQSKSREGLEPPETAIPCHVADLVTTRVVTTDR